MKTSNTITAACAYTAPVMRRAMDDALRPGGMTSTAEALERVPLSHGSLVLDAGCGPAKTTAFLLDQAECRVIGLDSDPQMKRPEAVKAANSHFVRGDICSIPFADRCLDAVFCECVLSLVSDPEGALAEIHRALKPGGLLYYSDMFARARGAVSILDTRASCLSAPADLETIQRRLYAKGFAPIAEIDQTILLRQTAARIIFEYGSLKLFWQEVLGIPDATDCIMQIKALRPGFVYFIAIRN
ncbi:MAG: methyltransferase domain-containing protein [Desulfobacteraceae bacterium]|nr:methyltransferase domain-containing protein [Desulfobacteraceae bacterium]